MAFDRNYISKDKMEELVGIIEKIMKMISSLITYLGKSDFDTKFAELETEVKRPATIPTY